MSNLKVYAWRKAGVNNFGDEMGPDILARLGHKVQRVELPDAEVVVIGSVLHHITRVKHQVIVAGAGVMHGDRTIDPSNMDIRLLRGYVSRDQIDWTKYPKDTAGPFTAQYGDPAMVAPLLYPPAHRKVAKLGWVPHYIDTRKMPHADWTVNVLDTPAEVIKQITSCSYILTSSLHALIIAQAYGIPAQRVPWHGVIGGDTKWVDYATGWAHNVDMTDGTVKSMTGSIYDILEGL